MQVTLTSKQQKLLRYINSSDNNLVKVKYSCSEEEATHTLLLWLLGDDFTEEFAIMFTRSFVRLATIVKAKLPYVSVNSRSKVLRYLNKQIKVIDFNTDLTKLLGYIRCTIVLDNLSEDHPKRQAIQYYAVRKATKLIDCNY